MKKAFLIFLPLLLLLPNIVCGHDIVAVMDAERSHYQQALLGFQKICECSPAPTGGVKSVHPLTLRTVIIGNKGKDEIADAIRSLRPDIILAVGNRGLRAAATITGVPVVYMLVTSPDRIIGKRDNITGIELRLPANLQIKAMHTHLPDLKRLGVLYDPRRTGALIDKARIAAPDYDITLLPQSINNRSKIPELLNSMLANRIDGFWMIPDLTVLSPATLQNLLLFSLEKKIPLITFSDKYLHQGAAVSITFDMHAIGAQAGRITQAIINGAPISTIAGMPADQVIVHANHQIIKKMGVNYLHDEQQGGAE